MANSNTMTEIAEKEDKWTYTYILHKFSKLIVKHKTYPYIRSPIFPSEDTQYGWQLVIIPINIPIICLRYVSIGLRARYNHETIVTCYARNSDDETLNQKRQLFNVNDQCSDFKNLKNSILDLDYHKLKTLKDDILKIRVVILKSAPCTWKSLYVFKTHLSNMKMALKNKTFTDFVIKISDFELPVHKVVIATQSSVFSKMLENDTLERKDSCVQITDMDKETLILMVDFMYTDEVKELSFEEAIKLYYAADKYDLQNLKEICEDTLLNELKVSNVIDILNLADAFNSQILIDAAIDVIIENHWKFLTSDSILNNVKSQRLLFNIALRVSKLLSLETHVTFCSAKLLSDILLKMSVSLLYESQMGSEFLFDMELKLLKLWQCETHISVKRVFDFLLEMFESQSHKSQMGPKFFFDILLKMAKFLPRETQIY